MANIISDETIEYVGILAKLELNEEEEGKEARLMTRVQVQRGRPQGRRRSKKRRMEERRKRKARE